VAHKTRAITLTHRKPTHALNARTYLRAQDMGMATNRHTPRGRGFDQSLIYYEHK